MKRPPPTSTLFPYNDALPISRQSARRGPAAVAIGNNGHVQAGVRRRREFRALGGRRGRGIRDRKSTRLNSSHQIISYAVFCLKKKNNNNQPRTPPTRSASQHR